MSEGKLPPVGSLDDLPRTLRREHESRERAAREQLSKREQTSWDRGGQGPSPGPAGRPEPANPYDSPQPAVGGGRVDATVWRFKVPFFSLMAFFIKAVFAAVPALLILTAMLYGLGIALQTYFPWLIKMKILISFPG